MKTLAGFSVLAALLTLLLPAAGLPDSPPPPPGWGKPPALPPANGTGTISFTQGGANHTLSLQKIETERIGAEKNILQVTLTFLDKDQQNRAVLGFAMANPKPGPIDDALITSILFKTASGTSKGNYGKTKCNMTVSAFSDKEAVGSASCSPLFGMNGTSDAPAVTDIKFSAKAN